MSAFCCRSARFPLRLKATFHRAAAISRAARAFAALAIGLTGSIAGIGPASAQAYPSRPVRWVIGFPAGGSTDTLVRIMAEWLQTRLGQTVLVENKSGAGSNIATEAVINAPPDGYTLAAVTSANAINATISKRTLTFDFLVHVPYRGSAPAITDLIGGQVQVMFDAMISTLPQIQSGTIRALGVTPAA